MTDAPNIILVTWDSVRADHLQNHGYHRDTSPTLSRLISDGLAFDDAQVPGVGTPTSFSGIFTGKHATGIQNRPYPEHWTQANQSRTFLSEHLQEEGYYTGAFHFNALMSRHFGWNRGWDIYEDHFWTEEKGNEAEWKTVVFDTLQRFDLANFAVHFKKMIQGSPPARWEAMWDDIAGFIEDAPEPFFLWVLLIDTHHPYYAPSQHQEWRQPGLRRMYALNYVMRRYPRIVGRRRKSIVNAYDNTIRYADAFLDRLQTQLASQGYESDPLIVHSDHGDELGEHIPHPYGHKPLMYDTVTRVPLVMTNVGETGWVHGPTSLLDLPSTILDLADSEIRPGDRPSLLSGEREKPDNVIVQNRLNKEEWMVGVVTEDWKLIHHPDKGREAYYRPDDPFEQDSLWGDHPSQLQEVLEDRLHALKSSKMDEQEAVDDEGSVDGAVQERLADLGYLN